MNQAEKSCSITPKPIARRVMRGEVCGLDDRKRDDFGLLTDVDRACTRWLIKKGLLDKNLCVWTR